MRLLEMNWQPLMQHQVTVSSNRSIRSNDTEKVPSITSDTIDPGVTVPTHGS